MENELVKNIIEEGKALDKKLRAKWHEAKAAGVGSDITREISKDVRVVDELVRNVNAENAEEYRARLTDLQTEYEFKYGEELPEPLEREEEETHEEERHEEETHEEAPVDAKPKKAKKGLLYKVTAVILLLATALHTGLALHGNGFKLSNLFNRQTRTMEDSENEESELAVVTEEETKTEEETQAVEEETKTEETGVGTTEEEENKTEETTQEQTGLVLGEYGTFFDVHDDAQVQARAQYIYDNYFVPIINDLQGKEVDLSLVTVENIANTIRTMNGAQALDKNGNKVLTGATVNENAHKFETYIANIISSAQSDHYYYIPAYLFAVDGSETSEFMKSYDPIYQKMVGAMNEGNVEEVRDSIACLGFKWWNEWYLQGMYNWANPHNLPTQEKYMAAMGTWYPYGTIASEANVGPVCITVCINPETGEMRELTVDQIWQALLFGNWNFVTEQKTGMDEPNHPWLPEYYQALVDYLTFDYDHPQTLGLHQ